MNSVLTWHTVLFPVTATATAITHCAVLKHFIPQGSVKSGNFWLCAAPFYTLYSPDELHHPGKLLHPEKPSPSWHIVRYQSVVGEQVHGPCAVLSWYAVLSWTYSAVLKHTDCFRWSDGGGRNKQVNYMLYCPGALTGYCPDLLCCPDMLLVQYWSNSTVASQWWGNRCMSCVLHVPDAFHCPDVMCCPDMLMLF